MGLFRRGTKLLRLGSGLRDCCCRPEQPEECWCPDLCSYYVTVDGQSSLDVSGCAPTYKTVIASECQEFDQVEPACTDFNGTTTNPSLAIDRYDLGISPNVDFFELPAGFVGARKLIRRVGVVYDIASPRQRKLTSYAGQLTVGFRCRVIDGQPRWQIFASINLSIEDEIIEPTPAPFPATGLRFTTISTASIRSVKTFGERFVDIDYPLLNAELFSDCQIEDQRICDLSAGTYSVRHMPSLTVAVNLSEVTISTDIGTQILSWPVTLDETVCNISDQSVSGAPINVPCTDPEPLLFPESDFLSAMSLSVQKRDSCLSGDCDCEVDLTGRTVMFEGQEFTYGSLQQFTSDDGSEFWEESPTGVFRKVTYDACDVSQQFIALEETAEIICSETIEEGQFWAVFFTVECRERDACGGAFDRSRTTLFNGIFTCDSEGFPSGTPTVELANDQLSDPAPTGDCASFPAAPSINFT
jgi:hypothetical protein